MKPTTLILTFFLHLVLVANATISVTSLRTEGMTNPQGIDTEKPRFSWKTEATTEQSVVQKSYQILVSSSMENLNNGNGDIWNSSKINSDASIWIPYAGMPVKSNKAYFWKVKVWTNKGESDWSKPAKWSMGLFEETDWKSAQWIGLDKAMPWDDESYYSRLSARYVRKEFSAKKRNQPGYGSHLWTWTL